MGNAAFITMPPLDNEQINLRKLSACDAEAYRSIRLSAITGSDSYSFVTDAKEECARSLRDWEKECTEKFDDIGRGTHVGIGAFLTDANGTSLLGSAFIERWNQDVSGQTAFYRSIYVDPNYRGHGIGEQIELMQDIWAIENGYNKSIFTIRTGKKRWLDRQINVFGGTVVKTVRDVMYADGKPALTYYISRNLIISADTSNVIHLRTKLGALHL